jgi:hypothetical protein
MASINHQREPIGSILTRGRRTTHEASVNLYKFTEAVASGLNMERMARVWETQNPSAVIQSLSGNLDHVVLGHFFCGKFGP